MNTKQPAVVAHFPSSNCASGPRPLPQRAVGFYQGMVKSLHRDRERVVPPGAACANSETSASCARHLGTRVSGGRLQVLSCSISLLFAVVPVSAIAAAWVQNAGQGLVIYTVDAYKSDKAWDDDGNSQSSPSYSKVEFNPYMEYGVTGATTVGANAFVLHVQQEGSGDNSGLGDVELFARHRLHTDGWDSLSTQLTVKIPGGYDKNDTLPLGAGQVDVEARMLYGRGGVYETAAGEKKSWYYDVEAALRKRFGEPADEFRLDLTAAWRPTPAWTLELKQGNILALSSTPPTNGTTISRWSDYDLHKIGVDVIYQISPTLSGNVGVNYDFAGRNTGQGISPFVAIWQRI